MSKIAGMQPHYTNTDSKILNGCFHLVSLDLGVITGQRHIEEVLLFSELSEGTADVRLEIVPPKAELLWGPHDGAQSVSCVFVLLEIVFSLPVQVTSLLSRALLTWNKLGKLSIVHTFNKDGEKTDFEWVHWLIEGVPYSWFRKCTVRFYSIFFLLNSTVDPKLFVPDPDPTFQVIPDPVPANQKKLEQVRKQF